MATSARVTPGGARDGGAARDARVRDFLERVITAVRAGPARSAGAGKPRG
ncbi:hypothetical protein [Streptomyces sp. CT34]|nr:hypothetical protein [Streptomyces sp. CT34]